MLSHIRFHRRGPSNPSSPSHDSAAPPAPWSPATTDSAMQPGSPYGGGPPIPASDAAAAVPDGRPRTATSAPQLPPITRVTSGDMHDLDIGMDATTTTTTHSRPDEGGAASQRPTTAGSVPTTEATGIGPRGMSATDWDRGFIGGVALEKERKKVQRRGEREDGGVDSSPAAGSRPALAPIQTASSPGPARNRSSFVAPTDFHTTASAVPIAAKLGPAGKRAAPSVSFSGPTTGLSASATGRTSGTGSAGSAGSIAAALEKSPPPQPQPQPQARPRRSFLKNPVSALLMRRRATQSGPDLAPLPLVSSGSIGIGIGIGIGSGSGGGSGSGIGSGTVPKYDDPSIRGTKVHDFSAPRPKKVPEARPAEKQLAAALLSPQYFYDFGTGGQQQPPISRAATAIPIAAAANQPTTTTVPTTATATTTAIIAATTNAAAATSDSNESFGAGPLASSTSADTAWRGLLADAKPLPMQSPQPPQSLEPQPSSHSRLASVKIPTITRSLSGRAGVDADDDGSAAAVPTDANVSATAAPPSRTVSVLSSVPRHMKSTSSRFSFDMVGSTKQERLLEERHRQRELERRIASPTSCADDDSEFDYEAMMHDDGLEEPIPGFNADYQEEEPIPGVNADYEEEEPVQGVNAYYKEDILCLNADYEEDIPGINVDYEWNTSEVIGDYENQIPVGGDIDHENIPAVNHNEEEEQSDWAEDKGAEKEGSPEKEDDPDNDQENFAGFVFSRSGPTSTLPTPHSSRMMATTPRDGDGNVIGFAMSKHTPDTNLAADRDDCAPDHDPAPAPASTLRDPSPNQQLDRQQEQRMPSEAPRTALGLGIHGLDFHDPPAGPVNAVPIGEPQVAPRLEGLDFMDSHFADELADNDGAPGQSTFDESLFDLDDTDLYGRPLPGAFALAKSMRMMAGNGGSGSGDGGGSHRQSESSCLSAQSAAVSQSTADTSVHCDGPQQPVPAPAGKQSRHSHHLREDQEDQDHQEDQGGREDQDYQPRDVAAYQAALAAAAHEAVASGKLRPDSTPSTPVDQTMPAPAYQSAAELSRESERDDYDAEFDADYARPLEDDYDDDDGDIISEANASALANDYDGWYGHEFNFYSAPAPAPTQSPTHAYSSSHIPHSSSSSSIPFSPAVGVVGSTSVAGVGAGTSPSTYEFANGGYFGPPVSVVHRTRSGRFVAREPNLTPVTERSEYSNRNSFMSLGLPTGGSGFYSPGLAQMATMADPAGSPDDHDMAFSALLRFRSRAWGGGAGGGGGGSQGASLASSQDGSPLSEHGPSPFAQLAQLAQQQQPQPLQQPVGVYDRTASGSGFSVTSRYGGSCGDDDSSEGGGGDDGQASPTLQLSLPGLAPPAQIRAGTGPGHYHHHHSHHNQQYHHNPPSSPQRPLTRDRHSSTSCSSSPSPGQLLSSPDRVKSSSTTAAADQAMTMTMAMATMTTATSPALSQVRRSSAPGSGGGGAVHGHRHKGSGDSISYRREEESGESRWVMERTRTGEGGAVEVLEREVVGEI